jgi:putative membrane protein insertion efficiency factor
MIRAILLAIIAGYRRFISPLLPSSCRFHPTCSQYAHQAIAQHGAARGSWLAAKRILKCHPFHPGGLDPVPDCHCSDHRQSPSHGS